MLVDLLRPRDTVAHLRDNYRHAVRDCLDGLVPARLVIAGVVGIGMPYRGALLEGVGGQRCVLQPVPRARMHVTTHTTTPGGLRTSYDASIEWGACYSTTASFRTDSVTV